MLQFKKSTIAAALLAVGMASGGVMDAQAATVTNLVITGGIFQMGVFTAPPGNTITNFSGANIIGANQTPTWSVGTAQHGAAPAAIMAWNFNGGGTWVNSFVSSCDPQNVDGCSITPHALPSATTAASSGATTFSSLDLGALYDNWNATDFNQGNVAATGTVNFASATNFTWTAHWTSKIVGGAFNGQTGTYDVSGTGAISAVPLPAAVWLMGSGLLGLVGVARRRKAA